MGNEQSQLSNARNRFGFQVLHCSKDVPLEPWFDFICGINGREIDDGDPRLFTEEVRNCGGNAVNLGVWSAKGQLLRNITIPLTTEDPTLGVSLKWMSLAAAEDVWHILDISPGSPAESAGLLPYSDFIIGTPRGVVRGESGLGELVEDHIDRPLQLYVYNHEFNVTREVTILPRRNWGGDGALGCVLGYGALHRLPPPLEEPLSQPGEALFEYPADDGGEPGPTVTTGQDDATFITPAFALSQQQEQQQTPPAFSPGMSPMLSQTQSPPPTSGPTSPPMMMMDPGAIAASQSGRATPSGAPPSGAPPPPMSSPYSQGQVPTQTTSRSVRGKARGARNNRVDMMAAYMQEEEDKSKKEDYSIDSASTKSPPPLGGKAPPPRKGDS